MILYLTVEKKIQSKSKHQRYNEKNKEKILKRKKDNYEKKKHEHKIASKIVKT